MSLSFYHRKSAFHFHFAFTTISISLFISSISTTTVAESLPPKKTATTTQQPLPQSNQGILNKGQAPAQKVNSKDSRGKVIGVQPRRPLRTFRPYGLQLSYLTTKMDANFTANGSNQKASMQGTGLGFVGYYDIPMSATFQVRAMAGFEQFYASENKGAAVCGNSTTANCDVKINYLSGYALGKVLLSRGRAPTYVAAGVGQLFAISKSSTVLDSGSISGNFVYIASLGADLTLGPRVGAPFSLDYVLFNSSAAVAASFIGLRAGVSWW